MCAAASRHSSPCSHASTASPAAYLRPCPSALLADGTGFSVSMHILA